MSMLFKKSVEKVPTMLGTAILAIAIAGIIAAPFGIVLTLTTEVVIASAAMAAAVRFA